MSSGVRDTRYAAFSALSQLLIGLVLFGPVFRGGALFLRDLSSQFYPDYSFLARSLGQGVWPLWHPEIHAGAPALFAYPVDLLLVALGGAPLALGAGVVLHFWVASLGATALARELGRSWLASFGAGAFYAASGTVLSFVNLLPLFEGAAWFPWVLACLLRMFREPGGRAAAGFVLALSLQVSSLAAETVVQAMIAALLLLPARQLLSRRLVALAGAVAVAALITAPAWLGVLALVRGTSRAGALAPDAALAFSAGPVVLGESLVPKLLGNVHSFSNSSFWGQPHYPDGFPYLLSLYLGVGVGVLAVAGRQPRLLALAAVGVLLALGGEGPLRPVLVVWATLFRAPVKFFLLTTLAVAQLAAAGIDRVRVRGASRWSLLPGVCLVAGALVLRLSPALGATLAPLLPGLAEGNTAPAAAALWSREWLVSGVLATGVGAAVVAGGGPAALLATLLAIADLLLVNHAINSFAPAAFYELRPEVAPLVERVRAAGPFRVFSYGAAYSPPRRWLPAVAAEDSDAWLYYVDRQALLPRTHVLDGLEGALEVDRTGWAPAAASLSVAETAPSRFREAYERLRWANVRFVLSFEPLPDDLVRPSGEARLREVIDPLRLYELRDPLPRAFWVPSLALGDPRLHLVLPDPPPSVGYRRLDPHTFEIHARTPPGYLVVLDGAHADWHVRGPAGEIASHPFGPRYWALSTPGGEAHYLASYEPTWRLPAFACSATGAALLLASLFSGPRAASGRGEA